MADQSDVTGNVTISMAEMVEMLRDQAHKLEASQKALVNSGIIPEFDPKMRRRIVVIDAAATMIERMEPYIDDFRKVVRSRRFAMRNGG